jgi:hypothetical protein
MTHAFDADSMYQNCCSIFPKFPIGLKNFIDMQNFHWQRNHSFILNGPIVHEHAKWPFSSMQKAIFSGSDYELNYVFVTELEMDARKKMVSLTAEITRL